MIVGSIHQPLSVRRPVVTIGIFDGVHTGHRFILDHLNRRAGENGGESVVVTLWPHPRIVLGKGTAGFTLLHCMEEKVRELGRCGVDRLIVIPFDRQVAGLTACEFVQKYLVEMIGVEVLLMGYDNRFGSDRLGDPEGLASCAAAVGFRIESLPEFSRGGTRVSSTVIREFIAAGDLVRAEEMLGYPYYLAGNIMEGNQLGRMIGYPTANIHPCNPYKLIPMNGVYAIRAELQGSRYRGMLNIGFRPTIDSGSAVKTIEAHLFDLSGDFYGEQIVIHFLKRIRNEMKFSGMDELKKQLDQDKAIIQEFI